MAYKYSNETPPPKQLKTVAGKRFGRLVATTFAGRTRLSNGALHYHWKCVCDCGNETVVTTTNLKTGHTQSCGCLHKERAAKVTGDRSRTHGKTHTRAHRIWAMMKDRCNNPKSTSYPNYGARGIKVCDRWANSFELFHQDMGDPPSMNHTLDRIDNDGNYEPSNCKWSTSAEQASNTRFNRNITFQGETRTLSEWARRLGISHSALASRLNKWPIEKALTAEPRR